MFGIQDNMLLLSEKKLKKCVLSSFKISLEERRTRLYTYYSMLALNLFKWDNLPDGIESRHIERFLYENGQVMFTDTKEYGLICLPCFGKNNMNIYGDFTAYNLTARNGVNYTRTDEDGVRVLNNDLAIPTVQFIVHYADAIARVENAIAINVDKQKFTDFIQVDEDSRLSVKMMMEEVQNGEPVVYGSKAMSQLPIRIDHFNSKLIANDLQNHKTSLENELMSFLGLNNANTEKRERLIVNEVDSNNEFIESNLQLMLAQRERACELINEKYNLNVTVRRRKNEKRDNHNIQPTTGGNI